MKMPFGIHKGEDVSSLSDRYVRWLYNNCDLWGDLKIEVYERLGIELPKHMSLEDKCELRVQEYEEQMRCIEINDASGGTEAS
jgi:hypothetical protein